MRTRYPLRAACCCLLAGTLAGYSSPVRAIPPLVSGDIPTADRGTYELFFGYVLKDGAAVTEKEIPFWELVYGLTKVQELTIEAPIVRRNGPAGTTTGIGDVILGTKYRFVGRPAADSGLSISLEVKLPTGDEDRGLGAGAVAVDLRARGGLHLVLRRCLGSSGGNQAAAVDGDLRQDCG